MNLYKHCTGTTQKSVNVYMVAYVNWKGEWLMDDKECETEKSATTYSKKVAKEKALNGRVSVQIMPKSKCERARLQKNINKF